MCVKDRLRQPEEEAAPGAELRRAHADAGAVADFIDLVEEIDDVEARRQALPAHQREVLADAEIDRDIVRHMIAIGRRAVPAQAGAVEQVGADSCVPSPKL